MAELKGLIKEQEKGVNMISKEEIQEVAKEFESKLTDLRVEYNTVINEINQDKGLTEIGKNEKIEAEYQIHKSVNDKIENEYSNKIMKMIGSRIKEANKKLEEEAESLVSDKLEASDILYIKHMAKYGAIEEIKSIARDYKYNKHVLNLINTISDYKVEDPYKVIAGEKYIDYIGFPTKVITRPTKSLWD